MQVVTIGSKYQVVIPKEVRKRVKNLKPGNKLKVYSTDEETIIIRATNKSWVEENYGSLKKYWTKIDPIKELEDMRNEWDK